MSGGAPNGVDNLGCRVVKDLSSRENDPAEV